VLNVGGGGVGGGGGKDGPGVAKKNSRGAAAPLLPAPMLLSSRFAEVQRWMYGWQSLELIFALIL